MWKPLLAGDSRTRAELKIDEIAEILSSSVENIENISLMGKAGGLALFFAYYGRYKNSDKHIDLCNDVLEKIIDLSNTIAIHYPFSMGISGALWAIQHLCDNGFIETDFEELFSEADEDIKNDMILNMQEGEHNYDFLRGSMGIAFYFLKRNNEKCDVYTEMFLEELTKSAISDKDKMTVRWKSTIVGKESKVKQVYDFGLSHGMASIINFLSRYLQKRPDKGEYLKLLLGAINYFKEHVQDPKIYQSYFPVWLELHESLPNPSRLAWCYGDLGIGISLFRAAKVLNDKKLEQYVLAILKYTASRVNPEAELVTDAGLCHGAMGNALLFHRLFNETMVKEFEDAASHWYNVGLNMATYKNGLAGFNARMVKQAADVDYGFLTGIAGIGLALISAISDIEPKWDECMLIS